MIRQLVADGWECHVALPAPARLADEYAAAGANLHIVGMARLTTSGGWGRWLLFALRWPVSVIRLTWLARRVGADVVHTNSLHSWYGWAAARLVRRPHVWHAREIVTQSALALRVERALARRFATQVISVSEAIARQLDPGNVVVITDEIDPDEFSPSRAGRWRGRVGLPEDAIVVGSAARIDVWKGFDVLLDSVPLIHATRPDVHLVVAGAPVGGKDEYAAGLAQRAASLERVHWLGHRDDIADLLADLDVFVQVSTNPEPYGLVLIEALTSGVPVVAGAAGGPIEILAGQSSSVGRLVPAGDAEALAGAVLALLPAVPSTPASRRTRVPLRQVHPGQWSVVFEAALSSLS